MAILVNHLTYGLRKKKKNAQLSPKIFVEKLMFEDCIIRH